ncbi:hypothetical protein [Hymenobacter convexus]|uniref:hypothetical protein n=1 Tax=Hymenobacter sp. CA1UV-4 TaxID=3063782 RepID=UPI0027127191|nr:hypothetical protein [Hymenobacter sp. CA1UV-4]MDO7854097.1 hypothetical protein [Hymenobacter sp. CA1UV-4]
MDNNNYLLRAARNVLVRQLGLAAPAPLPDLPVLAEEKVVMHGNFTLIDIAYSQPGVQYRLCDGEGRPVSGTKAEAEGTGGTLQLKTNSLDDEDFSFGVRAVRTPPETEAFLASFPEVKLLQAALVQVRIDTELPTALKEPAIAFAAPAEVWVLGAQSKTQYQLVDEQEQPLGTAVVTRVSGDLQLWTDALTEDTTIVVRATSTKTSKTSLSDLLTHRLRVEVKPNVDLAAVLSPPVVDYNSRAVIRLADTQKTASYQLLITDADGTAQPADALPVAGTGGEIELPIGALREDCTVGIRATKVASGLAEVLPVQLTVPVRPDPAKELSLVESLTEAGKNTAVSDVAAGTAAIIKVANTQLGVCYQLRAGTSPIGMPAYHHINAGIGKARVGLEFAVDTFSGDAVYLPTGVLTQDTAFSVFAYKPTREAEGVVVGTIAVPVRPDGA